MPRAVVDQALPVLPHAIRQMARPQRMITRADVETTVTQGLLVEDYPEGERGHSCLLLGAGNGGCPVHVVCSPKQAYLAIITAYIPEPAQWLPDFLRRT